MKNILNKIVIATFVISAMPIELKADFGSKLKYASAAVAGLTGCTLLYKLIRNHVKYQKMSPKLGNHETSLTPEEKEFAFDVCDSKFSSHGIDKAREPLAIIAKYTIKNNKALACTSLFAAAAAVGLWLWGK